MTVLVATQKNEEVLRLTLEFGWQTFTEEAASNVSVGNRLYTSPVTQQVGWGATKYSFSGILVQPGEQVGTHNILRKALQPGIRLRVDEICEGALETYRIEGTSLNQELSLTIIGAPVVPEQPETKGDSAPKDVLGLTRQLGKADGTWQSVADLYGVDPLNPLPDDLSATIQPLEIVSKFKSFNWLLGR